MPKNSNPQALHGDHGPAESTLSGQPRARDISYQRRPTTARSSTRSSKRVAITSMHDRPGVIETTSRSLYASRSQRGPLTVSSPKAKGRLGCESALESLFVVAARFDDRIQSITAQPVVIELRSGLSAPNQDQMAKILAEHGIARSDAKLWFVDFEVRTTPAHERVLVEVKPDRRAGRLVELMEERRAACARLGARFLLAKDTDFPEPLGSNLRILQRYADYPISAEITAHVQAVAAQEITRFDALAEAAGCGFEALYALVATGMLDADLRVQPLNPRAMLCAPSGERRALLPFREEA